MMEPVQTDRKFTIVDNVLKGKEVSHDEERFSLGELIFHKLGENPDSVGQIDAVTGEEYTFRKMKERSVRCALWMQSQGVCPRDVVAVCANNHMDYAIPCFAALYLGAICNPWHVVVDTEYSVHQMNVTKPKMVFVNEGVAAIIAQAAKETGHDLKIIVFGHELGFLDFERIIAEPSINEVKKFGPLSLESSEEIAIILFSSGSTGLSKGVALSHRAVIMQFHQTKAIDMDGNVCLCFSIASWINGMHNMLWSVLLGIPRPITPIFEDDLACALIEKYKASWLFLTTTMINRLVKSDAMDKYDLSSVSKVFYSGMWLSIPTRRAFKERLPNAKIFSCYGLTEVSGFLSMQSMESQPGSCGQILENVQLKVIDLDTGRILGANQKGELLTKSAAVMNCYYNNPHATAQTIDDDGWLHTGDICYYDEDGEIFVFDRLKDVIRCYDIDICPSEIEKVILTHPGVKEVAVVGKPHPDGEEHPIAFVVRADSSGSSKQVTEMEIVNLVASELKDSIKQLRAGVRFIDNIPRTPSYKIRRTVLRDMARLM